MNKLLNILTTAFWLFCMILVVTMLIQWLTGEQEIIPIHWDFFGHRIF